MFHLPISFPDHKGGITNCLPSTEGTVCCHRESQLFLEYHHTRAWFLQKPASPDAQDELGVTCLPVGPREAKPHLGALNDQRKAMKVSQ